MKRTLFLILTLLLLVSFTAWSGGQQEAEEEKTEEAQTVQWNFTTGSMGGGFYAIGGGIADFVTKNVDEIFLTAVTSGGVNENINRLHSADAEFGMLNNTDPPLAFAGEAPYTQKFDNMRGVGILYMQYVEVFTLEKTGIKTFSDLKDRVVCVGSPGGSMHKTLFDIVGMHGIDPEKDFKKSVYLPAREAMEALKLGQVEAVMEISTLPTPSLSELALTHDVRIVKFDPGIRDKLVQEMPKYLLLTIPDGAYPGVGEVDTIGSAAMWGCNKDLPEDLVYKAVKAVYGDEGLKYLSQVHPAGSGISLETAAKFKPIPLHPGAEKFYKESGVLD
jgi:uncharacterized protein